MIVALARKLLIALWRYVHTGEVPGGVVLKAASQPPPAAPAEPTQGSTEDKN